MTISSASRDKWMAAIVAAAMASNAKSRSAMASSALAEGRSKPSALADWVRSIGKGEPGERGGAQWALVHTRARVGKTRRVAAEHLHIGHEVVAKGHGLRRLQMGEARHQSRRMRLGFGDQRLLQCSKLGASAITGFSDPHAEIQGDLVIARAGGIKTPSRGSDELAQARLDVHVDVFILVAERDGPGGQPLADGGEAVLNGALRPRS